MRYTGHSRKTPHRRCLYTPWHPPTKNLFRSLSKDASVVCLIEPDCACQEGNDLRPAGPAGSTGDHNIKATPLIWCSLTLSTITCTLPISGDLVRSHSRRKHVCHGKELPGPARHPFSSLTHQLQLKGQTSPCASPSSKHLLFLLMLTPLQCQWTLISDEAT